MMENMVIVNLMVNVFGFEVMQVQQVVFFKVMIGGLMGFFGFEVEEFGDELSDIKK